LTVLEMALSVADKIGNRLRCKIISANSFRKIRPFESKDVIDSLNSLGELLSEALQLMTNFQSIKTPRSIPAPGGKT